MDVYFVVSQATKNAEGKIVTAIGDLKLPREMKETNLLKYFAEVDKLCDKWPSHKEMDALYATGKAPPQVAGMSPEAQSTYMQRCGKWSAVEEPQAKLMTFKQLARNYAADETVHYTTSGGPKGGDQVAAIIEGIKASRGGKGPEVLLSLDTMAILPASLLNKYQCFSCHPGPLDTVKIEGMQGTLRSIVNQAFYDNDGKKIKHKPLPGEMLNIKGTLFLQHPELDKGPGISTVLTTVVLPYMSAYETRDHVYGDLTDKMLELLPILLDHGKRTRLVRHATHEKEKHEPKNHADTPDLEAALYPKNRLAHVKVPKLDEEQLRRWQNNGVISFDEEGNPSLSQNSILDPQYFRGQMRDYFPGTKARFAQTYDAIYAQTEKALDAQSDERLTDHWARLLAGKGDTTITQTFYPNGHLNGPGITRVFRNLEDVRNGGIAPDSDTPPKRSR